ncbi:SpoIIAA-like protein [Aliiruegeria haliotis]|uniref:SpoIIAA-like protein n=1 Tax=Aliiruegeria haliotis TaxID=1280846 RepID=A0A2T0RH22_9RHOB|nr:STAS/SEC14 domain-containing protein [Aliiruegeria haliotis]PRY20473.1 SpoIIAA-like protein [Aliiruegeria haliotis]
MSIEIDSVSNVATVTPDKRLTEADIKELKQRIDDYINEQDKVPNLVVQANEAPIWEDVAAMSSHIAFVKQHHQLVKKVAIVSDSAFISMARPLVDVFTAAKVRHFGTDALDDAANWAAMEDDHPGEVILLDGFPRDVLAVRMAGIITSRDYSETFVPAINAAKKEHGKVKLFCVLDQYFDGYSAGAAWDDMRLGFTDFSTFSKVAIVTDVEWIRKGAKFFGGLSPAEVMVFNLDDMDAATSWIKT